MKPNNNGNNFRDRKPQYWERMTTKQRGIFSIVPLITPILICAVVIGIYLVIMAENLFPDFQLYLYYAVKIIIAFEVLAASARTLWGPVLAMLIGGGIYYAEQTMDLPMVAAMDGMQLMIVAGIGFLVTLIVKLL